MLTEALIILFVIWLLVVTVIAAMAYDQSLDEEETTVDPFRLKLPVMTDLVKGEAVNLTLNDLGSVATDDKTYQWTRPYTPVLAPTDTVDATSSLATSPSGQLVLSLAPPASPGPLDCTLWTIDSTGQAISSAKLTVTGTSQVNITASFVGEDHVLVVGATDGTLTECHWSIFELDTGENKLTELVGGTGTVDMTNSLVNIQLIETSTNNFVVNWVGTTTVSMLLLQVDETTFVVSPGTARPDVITTNVGNCNMVLVAENIVLLNYFASSVNTYHTFNVSALDTVAPTSIASIFPLTEDQAPLFTKLFKTFADNNIVSASVTTGGEITVNYNTVAADGKLTAGTLDPFRTWNGDTATSYLLAETKSDVVTFLTKTGGSSLSDGLSGLTLYQGVRDAYWSKLNGPGNATNSTMCLGNNNTVLIDMKDSLYINTVDLSNPGVVGVVENKYSAGESATVEILTPFVLDHSVAGVSLPTMLPSGLKSTTITPNVTVRVIG